MRYRALTTAAAALAVFVFSWFFRFNDPNGGFAGLTDDHFFYLVRGWQILYGELPVRDLVDHGAPLYFYISAAVQWLFGRGTLSELVFSTTMIALAAALTFWLAARASGSLLAGLLGATFQIALLPRFYNYPKLLVYAAAIPVLWWFADRPVRTPIVWLAVITVIGFLLRHDHGVFVALASAAMILLVDVRWTDRARHALLYAALVIALMAPYLLFIQVHGGLGIYMRQAVAWTSEERARTPVQWPEFDNPDGVSDDAREGPPLQRADAALRDNRVAWTYYFELVLPLFALALLALSRDGFRPRWPNAVPKIAVVGLLGLVLNAGFLRSPLEARLADPSVPHAILIAWLAVALPRMLLGRASWRPSVEHAAVSLRFLGIVSAVALGIVMWVVLTMRLPGRLEDAYLTDGPGQAVARARRVAQLARDDWNLETWTNRADRSGLMTLAMYLNACTSPEPRIFVQPYIPQVLGMARRGFAAGYGDLRPGFFEAPEFQALAFERMRHQDIPVVLLDVEDSLANFRESFPALTAYFDSAYEVAGSRMFDERFGITLLVKRDARRTGVYEPLGWPCLWHNDPSASSVPIVQRPRTRPFQG